MLYVLFKRSRKDEDVVQVYQHECIQLLSEYLIHEMLERCWCIRNPKRHYYEFEVASLHPKRRFVNIFFLYSYLMVAGGQIDCREMVCLP